MGSLHWSYCWDKVSEAADIRAFLYLRVDDVIDLTTGGAVQRGGTAVGEIQIRVDELTQIIFSLEEQNKDKSRFVTYYFLDFEVSVR